MRLGDARSRIVAQAVGYIGSNVLVSAAGAVASALLARNLATGSFGSYSFASSFLAFAAMFFEFGLFLPGARLAAQADAVARRRILGAALIAYAPVGIGFCAVVFGLSFGVDRWFHVDAGSALRLVAPISFVFPFGFVAVQLSQGMGRLHVYSATSVGGKLLFVAAIAAVAGLATLGISSALLLETLALLATWAAFVLWLRPSFRSVRGHVASLVRGARDYGFQVYLGRVLSVGTYNMDVLMVGAFVDARAVGFYALAGAMASLLSLPGAGIAAALFQRMATRDRMDPRWLLWTWAFGAVGLAGALLLGKPFVRIVFSSRYLPAYALLLPLGLASVVRGATTLYNTFLAAHARGRELRNAAVVLTASNLVLNFALIPPFGAKGAAWASFFALLANFAAHVVSYRRVLVDMPTGSAAT